MNKGLEYIQARWLFNASASQMQVLIHPQSVIHSMVRYQDGSVAQLGKPAYAYANCPHHGMAELRELWREAAEFLQTKCVDICRTGL